MRAILEFFVLGMGEGALISGVALALVLFYRGSGTINLAAGCVPMRSGRPTRRTTSGTSGSSTTAGARARTS